MRTRFLITKPGVERRAGHGFVVFHLAGTGGTIPEHCRLASRVALHQVPPEQRGISLVCDIEGAETEIF